MTYRQRAMLRQETSSSEYRLCVGRHYKHSKGLTASNQSRPSGSTTAGHQALAVSVAPAN